MPRGKGTYGKKRERPAKKGKMKRKKTKMTKCTKVMSTVMLSVLNI